MGISLAVSRMRNTRSPKATAATGWHLVAPQLNHVCNTPGAMVEQAGNTPGAMVGSGLVQGPWQCSAAQCPARPLNLAIPNRLRTILANILGWFKFLCNVKF